jgi:hypothetical protein
MSKTKLSTSLLALVLLLVAGVANAADTGSASFTRYVSLGDSLTAGYWSAGLENKYQNNSYPMLIWEAATGSRSGFEQPLVSPPGIPAVLQLNSLLPSISIGQTPGQGQPLNLTLPRPYNNMAVPGATVHDLLNTKTGGLHDLILRGQGFTQIQQGLSLQPTFVTLWIGNNDVLGYATSGGTGPLTPWEQFDAEFRGAAAAIAGVGAKMAFANIPDVTSIPFFTTVPRVVVNPATNQPVLINGNPVPLIGPNGPLVAGDLVLLPATAALAQGIGSRRRSAPASRCRTASFYPRTRLRWRRTPSTT